MVLGTAGLLFPLVSSASGRISATRSGNGARLGSCWQPAEPGLCAERRRSRRQGRRKAEERRLAAPWAAWKNAANGPPFFTAVRRPPPRKRCGFAMTAA